MSYVAPTIGDSLRHWRRLKKMSQMQLALSAGISTKHLSFVETGRARPSRTLILSLAEALELPLRQGNALLLAAGYPAEFKNSPLTATQMPLVHYTLQCLLNQHEPYPAWVVDGCYDLVMRNEGFERIVTDYLGSSALTEFDNVYRLVFAPNGLRSHIADWPSVAQLLLTRLYGEAISTQNSRLLALYDELSDSNPPIDASASQVDSTIPVMCLTLCKDGQMTRFFSTITTFGTPLDVTTQELRIECLFPADEQTRQLFNVS